MSGRCLRLSNAATDLFSMLTPFFTGAVLLPLSYLAGLVASGAIAGGLIAVFILKGTANVAFLANIWNSHELMSILVVLLLGFSCAFLTIYLGLIVQIPLMPMIGSFCAVAGMDHFLGTAVIRHCFDCIDSPSLLCLLDSTKLLELYGGCLCQWTVILTVHFIGRGAFCCRKILFHHALDKGPRSQCNWMHWRKWMSDPHFDLDLSLY